MRKLVFRAAVAAVTTAVCTVAATALLRQNGDATGVDVMTTEIVDLCGNVVRDGDGDPVVIEIQIEPPPVKEIVGSGLSESTPLLEAEMVAAPIPADTRQVTGKTC